MNRAFSPVRDGYKDSAAHRTSDKLSSENISDKSAADASEMPAIRTTPEVCSVDSEINLIVQADMQQLQNSSPTEVAPVQSNSTNLERESISKRFSKRHLRGCLIAVCLILVFLVWMPLVEYVNGPIPLQEQTEVCLIVPGRYSICLEPTTKDSVVPADPMLLQLAVFRGDTEIPLRAIEKPGKYGSFFPFDIVRTDKNGIAHIEQPIQCFDVTVPGIYTLSARASAQAALRGRFDLAIARNKDLLTVLPTLPFFLLLLAIPFAIVWAVCRSIINYQPNSLMLRFIWNRVFCLVAFLFLEGGALFGSGALMQLVMGSTEFPAEILLGAVCLSGLLPIAVGAFLLRIQFRRFFQHADDLKSVVLARIWKVIMCGFGALMLVASGYAAVVCIATIYPGHLLAAIPYWGAPLDIACGVLVASMINIVVAMMILFLQFRKSQTKAI